MSEAVDRILPRLIKFPFPPIGLCCQLTKPAQRPQPREGRSNALEYATRDQYEIPRSQISLTKKLGAGNFGEVWKGTWQGRVEVWYFLYCISIP